MKIHVSIFEHKTPVFDGRFTKLPVTIGRSLRSDICLSQYPWVSRDHALIYQEDKQIFIMDINSSNGIYLHRSRIEKMKIDAQAEVKLGSLTMKVAIESTDSEEEDTVDTVKLSPEEFERLLLQVEYAEKIENKKKPRRRKEDDEQGDFDTSPMISFSDELTPVVIPNEEEAGFWDRTDPNLFAKIDSQPIQEKHFSRFTPHPEASTLSVPQRHLEIAIIKDGQVVVSKFYGDRENVLVDPKGQVGPKVDSIDKAQWIARMQSGKVEVYIPASKAAYLVDSKGKLQKIQGRANPTEKNTQYELVVLPLDQTLILELSDQEAVGLRIARRFVQRPNESALHMARQRLRVPIRLLASFGTTAMAILALWAVYPSQIRDKNLPTATAQASREPASAEPVQVSYSVEAKPHELNRPLKTELEKTILPSLISACFLEAHEPSHQERFEIAVILKRENKKIAPQLVNSKELKASTYNSCVTEKLKQVPWAKFSPTNAKLLRIIIESR